MGSPDWRKCVRISRRWGKTLSELKAHLKAKGYILPDGVRKELNRVFKAQRAARRKKLIEIYREARVAHIEQAIETSDSFARRVLEKLIAEKRSFAEASASERSRAG